MNNVEKSIEISDAKIQFVSLVDKAANLRQFLVTKGQGGRAQFSSYGKIIKVDAATHYITGIVYEPLVEDAHGNFMTEAEITKAAYWFAKNGDKVDLQHSFEGEAGLAVVENYVAPCDMDIGGTSITKGSWIITVECSDNDIWEAVQKGELTGFSMGGLGKYAEEETTLETTEKSATPSGNTPLPSKSDKKGLLKRFAEALGLDPIEKGEVLDKFKDSSRSTQFWNALHALEDVLYHYSWSGDRYVFVSDPDTIKSALEDFSAIITQVLTEEPDVIAKSITMPVLKAGKKMSSGNKKKLDDICQALSDFKTGFDEEDEDDGEKTVKKEETDMNELETKTLIVETVRKALEGAGVVAKAATPEATPAAEPVAQAAPATDMDAAVEKAVRKCLEGCGLLEPEPEPDKPVTKADIENVVADTVAKAIEPLLKSRGLATNLNAEQPVEKAGGHYLHGIL
ncbi:MAG: XkdF-like putative serine protease domain-containing protein [Bacteroides sp.]